MKHMKRSLFLSLLTLSSLVGFYACQQQKDAPSVSSDATPSQIAKLAVDYYRPLKGSEAKEIGQAIAALTNAEAALLVDALYQEDLKRLAEFAKNPVMKAAKVSADGKETLTDRRLTAEELAEMKAEYGQIRLRKKLANETAGKQFNKTVFTLQEEALGNLMVQSYAKFPDPKHPVVSQATARTGADYCATCVNPDGYRYNFYKLGTGLYIFNDEAFKDAYAINGFLTNDDLPGTGECDYSFLNYGNTNDPGNTIVHKNYSGYVYLGYYGGTGRKLATGNALRGHCSQTSQPYYTITRALLGSFRTFAHYGTYDVTTLAIGVRADLGLERF